MAQRRLATPEWADRTVRGVAARPHRVERRTPIPGPARCRARRPSAWRRRRSQLRALASLSPSAIVSSDLVRARATAQALADPSSTCPCAPTRGCARSTSAVWQGLTFDEVAERSIRPSAAAWRDGGSGRRGGGETLVEVGERATAAVEKRWLTSTTAAMLVVATHGACGRAIVASMIGLPTTVVAVRSGRWRTVAGRWWGRAVGAGGCSTTTPGRCRRSHWATTGSRAGSARLPRRPRGQFGALAQLVEHLPGRQGVRGSSPLSSTHCSTRLLHPARSPSCRPTRLPTPKCKASTARSPRFMVHLAVWETPS